MWHTTSLAMLAMLAALACSPSSKDSGAVTTAEDAIASAREGWEAIHEKATWKTIYSKEHTTQFEPYTASYEDGVWVVRGTVPAGYRGETLETRVREADGSVSVTAIRVE